MGIGLILLLIALVDLEAFFIPDLLVTVGSLLAGIASFLGIGVPLGQSLMAAVIGFVIMQGIRLGYQFVRKQEGMGFGDVKLMFLLGLCSGIQGLPYVFLLSSVLALLCTLLAHRKNIHKETKLPFGPYLCAGCALYMLFGESLFPC